MGLSACGKILPAGLPNRAHFMDDQRAKLNRARNRLHLEPLVFRRWWNGPAKRRQTVVGEYFDGRAVNQQAQLQMVVALRYRRSFFAAGDRSRTATNRLTVDAEFYFARLPQVALRFNIGAVAQFQR